VQEYKYHTASGSWSFGKALSRWPINRILNLCYPPVAPTSYCGWMHNPAAHWRRIWEPHFGETATSLCFGSHLFFEEVPLVLLFPAFDGNLTCPVPDRLTPSWVWVGTGKSIIASKEQTNSCKNYCIVVRLTRALESIPFECRNHIVRSSYNSFPAKPGDRESKDTDGTFAIIWDFKILRKCGHSHYSPTRWWLPRLL